MSEYHELPGLGPRNNQRVFYIASCIVLLNFVLIIAISSYTATLMSDAAQTLTKLDEILDDADKGINMINHICNNSTRLVKWGLSCN
jgi:ABC-type bacteriocin/lantibiotic exporter with double-glycine peptidase domain